MCFTLNRKYPKSKIAEKDIICYKILNRRTAPHQEWFVYQKNVKTKKEDLVVHQIMDDDPAWINEGYHSYKSFWQYIPKYDNFAQIPRAHFGIYKMVIPKGAKYWENEAEYVSETIILKRKAFLYSFLYIFF